VTPIPTYKLNENCVFQLLTVVALSKAQDNVHTNTKSVQCISIVYSICPYKYNQWAV